MTAAASLMNNPAIVGLIVGCPSAVLGYLGYRRARRNDEVAKQAGISTANTESIGQVVSGQNDLIDNLQTDNTALRQQVRDLNKQIDRIVKDCREQMDRVIEDCRELKRQVALLSQAPT